MKYSALRGPSANLDPSFAVKGTLRVQGSASQAIRGEGLLSCFGLFFFNSRCVVL